LSENRILRVIYEYCVLSNGFRSNLRFDGHRGLRIVFIAKYRFRSDRDRELKGRFKGIAGFKLIGIGS
jgi:hypothetical protein